MPQTGSFRGPTVLLLPSRRILIGYHPRAIPTPQVGRRRSAPSELGARQREQARWGRRTPARLLRKSSRSRACADSGSRRGRARSALLLRPRSVDRRGSRRGFRRRVHAMAGRAGCRLRTDDAGLPRSVAEMSAAPAHRELIAFEVEDRRTDATVLVWVVETTGGGRAPALAFGAVEEAIRIVADGRRRRRRRRRRRG